MDTEFAALERVIHRYFDGLHHSDSALLAEVFHPEASYLCATDGQLFRLEMTEYLQVVKNRPSPASRREPRTDAILSMEFAGPVTAFARVECSIEPKHFIDFLTFVRVDGRWQIVSKVFHYETRDATRI